ncbi:MAG: glycosyltransferase family 2 protein [Bacteroidota bacterium]
MKVSITIPCRNEEKYIAKCLQSIINTTYPKELLQVFVCDGMSDDGSVEIIQGFTQKHSFIKLLENKFKTTQYALNMGLKASDADVKIILGAHAEIYPDYIEECIKAFDIDPQIGCVGGVLENVMEDERSKIISLAMSSSFGVGNAHFRTGEKDGFVDTVAFGAYKKNVFEKAGYFDEDLVRNQDDEFSFRALKTGFKIYLSKTIKAKYYVRASFKKLFSQYYQYGYWKVYVNRKHRTVTTLRQLVPALFVLYLVGGFFLSFLHFYIAITYLLLLFSYFVLAFKSAFTKSGNIRAVLNIVYTFVILHWSYGIGYLKGIIDFFIFQKEIKKDEILTR